MRLYTYEHCPYCVRARMIFGLKNIPVDVIVLANHHEDTPMQLVGRKVVPILADSDGMVMPESLDIVRYVDKKYGEPCLKENVREEVSQWLQKVGSYYNHLVIPRFTQIGLKEFAMPESVEYFTMKKSKMIGNFAENLAQTPQYLAKINQDLKELNDLIVSPKASSGELSIEDIVLFPVLRNLTIVKGIEFPNKVAAYVKKMSLMSGVELYTERAV
ncbi:glutaredoxin 2 [Gallibacterium anatis]|uniref:Glutaredoxin n=3 Tax=Gallibacterium TaxID=155493 RepID=A0A0A3B0K3_9PAST|nr:MULTISPECIES: glutaredoxin 2 [Gallibacterium]ERF78588.1 glutaredoxin [Gallibacterium anatis 12656/12]KGQ34684.1 glutaredoxin [Gallibacterium anatis]KGQ38664.1 glutaredoxin [Gallibacterium anatis]KGQ41389.1 glutaredoxin [Gallibacterium anatis IPDH697-78]KGQ44337.1 glutaredoxin [Gallibacterium anatis]